MWEKQPLSFFNISKNRQESQQKDYNSDIFWTFKSKLQIIHAATYIHCFFPTLINVFFYMFSTIHPYLSLLFTFFFLLFSSRDTFYNLPCLIRFHCNLPVISRRLKKTKYFIVPDERHCFALIITKTNPLI